MLKLTRCQGVVHADRAALFVNIGELSEIEHARIAGANARIHMKNGNEYDVKEGVDWIHDQWSKWNTPPVVAPEPPKKKTTKKVSPSCANM